MWRVRSVISGADVTRHPSKGLMQTIVDTDGDMVRARQTVIVVHAPPPHVVSALVCLYHELLIAYLLIIKR